MRPPFGIAQIGKAFRNEVTPRNYIFRSREFEQMEMEWFCAPDEAKTWFDFWTQDTARLVEEPGQSKSENLILRLHRSGMNFAHYAKTGEGTYDVEYLYPFTAPEYG